MAARTATTASPHGWLDGLRRSRYTRGEGEFWSLSRKEALARIDVGIEWFAKNGWPLSGFVAPAWLLGPGAREALVERPFEYTATLRQLVHLPDQTPVTSQSVVYSTSSAWRRASSLAWNAVRRHRRATTTGSCASSCIRATPTSPR